MIVDFISKCPLIISIINHATKQRKLLKILLPLLYIEKNQNREKSKFTTL